MTFAAGSQKIVSGFEDGKAMIWEWQTSESAVRVLEGHGEAVMDIAVHSDGGRVLSCSRDGTLRTWDISTGAETEVLSQGNAVCCVAVCGENRMIAFGLRDRRLRVLDCRTKDVLFEEVLERSIILCFV